MFGALFLVILYSDVSTETFSEEKNKKPTRVFSLLP